MSAAVAVLLVFGLAVGLLLLACRVAAPAGQAAGLWGAGASLLASFAILLLFMWWAYGCTAEPPPPARCTAEQALMSEGMACANKP